MRKTHDQPRTSSCCALQPTLALLAPAVAMAAPIWAPRKAAFELARIGMFFVFV